MSNNAEALLKSINDQIQELEYRKSVLEAFLAGEKVVAVNPATGEKTVMNSANNFEFDNYIYGVTYNAITISKDDKGTMIAIDDVDLKELADKQIYYASADYYTRQPVNREELAKGIYPAWATYIYIPYDGEDDEY